jgi:hypothetical protein
MRVPAPEDRESIEVSEDQQELDFPEESPVEETGTYEEEGIKEDGATYFEGDVLTASFSTSSNEQLARETALGMAVTLLAGRKNVNSSLAIEYAQEFEEYIING